MGISPGGIGQPRAHEWFVDWVFRGGRRDMMPTPMIPLLQCLYNNDEQAPPSPDGTYAAYVCNTNDFAVQIVSTNNVYDHQPV